MKTRESHPSARLPSLVARAARRLGHSLADLCFPEPCALCGAELPPGTRSYPLCARCERELRREEEGRGAVCRLCGRPLVSERDSCLRCRGSTFAFSGTVALSLYEGAVASLLRAYKLSGHRRLANFYADRVAERLSSDPALSGGIVVPVPFSPRKLRARGWDQVEEIARRLEARAYRVARPLRRRPGAEQKSLGREDRARNAESSYELKPGARVEGRCALLDDVMTTGATAGRCARLLLEAGASEVRLLVIAAD